MEAVGCSYTNVKFPQSCGVARLVPNLGQYYSEAPPLC